MGSSSSSSSRQTNANQSTTIGVQGDNTGQIINGTGNHITTTDHGLIDKLGLVFEAGLNAQADAFGSMVASNENIASGALSLADSLGSDAFYTADSLGREAIRAGGGLARDALSTSEYITDGAFDFAGSLSSEAIALARDVASGGASISSDALNTVGSLANESMYLSAETAKYSADKITALAYDAMTASNDALDKSLAHSESVFSLSADSMALANENNAEISLFAMDAIKSAAGEFATITAQMNKDQNSALVAQSKQAMQFADGITRSDDAMLAKDASNKQIYLVFGVGLMVAVVAVVASKKG